MLKKVEISASSFDKLRMRVSDFKGLDLMVSLSNHGPHLFQQPAKCGCSISEPSLFREAEGRSRARFRLAASLAAFVLFLLPAVLFVPNACEAEPKFPPLTGRVVDDAHLLTPADKAAIESDLKALEDKSSDQLAVYTTNSLQGYPIEDYGYQLGRAWGIGQKGTNNGVILIVAPNERKVRIEVGRGLEPQLTDALTKLIIQNAILPRFKRGEFSAGIKAGVQDIRDVMLGDAEAVKERAAQRPAKRNAPDNEELITLVIFIAIFLFVLWVQSRQAGPPLSGGPYTRRGRYGGGPIFIPGDWSGGGFGGRGGGGGGGWSGGGGDFGGGGASGDW